MREFQALGVVHRHDRHRALRGGTAAGADSDIVLAQLAGNFFTTLIGAGEHTDGDVLLALGPLLDMRGKHCSFLRLGDRVQHNRCRSLTH